MSQLMNELRWRGMLHNSTPETEKYLNGGMGTGYIGFDPTAASLHIGNLATLMMLVQLQRAGHKPIALAGGATGMVGDPSGKSEERKFLDEEVLRYNQDCISEQLKQFLDFSGANAAEVVNNYDWFKNFNFLDFLRQVGKHLTINYMMAKDSVQNRIETGISYTEFTYQLLQGYDFYHLYKTKNCRLQMGGSDQWGNITSGIELIRRKESAEAHAITCPLVTKADGSKFGKSEQGNVWLDPKMTSPYQFYQFWLKAKDEEAPKLIRVFSLLGQEKIADLEKTHAEAPHLLHLQRALAEDVTVRVHGRSAYETAVKASEILFGKSAIEEINQLPESVLLSVFEGVPQIKVAREELSKQQDMQEFLSNTTQLKICPSKSEARKLIQNGGVRINKEKITDFAAMPTFELLQNKYLLVQKGKTNYFLVIAE